MLPPEVLALGTAICTAFSSMLAAEIGRHGDILAFSRWKMLFGAALTLAIATAIGAWPSLAPWHLGAFALSGLLGIVVADPAFTASVLRLGARRAMLVFALSAPMAALLGYLLLGESLAPRQAGGILLVFAGVALVVLFGGPERSDGLPAAADESVDSPAGTAARKATLVGLAFGLVAALGQAGGNVAARPAMADQADPMAAMAVRVAFSALAFVAIAALPYGRRMGGAAPGPRFYVLAALSSGFGMVLGMTLLMMALADGNVGIVSTLASLTPVAVLPMVWLRTGRRPSWRAWAGAALAAGGTALIFLR